MRLRALDTCGGYRVADHLSEEHLGRFFRAEDVADWREILGHLAACEPCLHRSLPWLDLLLIPEQVGESAVPVLKAEDYEAAIDRAFQAACKELPRIKAEKKRLAEALARAELPQETLGGSKRVKGWIGILLRLHRSFELRYVDPEGMLREAFLARTTALNLDERVYGAPLVADLRARAAAELANAYRVAEDFRSAAEHFLEAERFREQGTGDLLLVARIGDLKASLAVDERRFGDALHLIDGVRALYEEIGEHHLAGRALVKRAAFVGYEGKAEQAQQDLRTALILLDRARDPRLYASAQLNFLDWCVVRGEYFEARRLLFSSGLRQSFSSEPSNLLKVQWVEAKMHAGLGRLDRAEQTLGEVRRGFVEQGRPYDAALAGLTLAEVWMRQGDKLREVAALAVEMHEVFAGLGIGREALRAARYLAEACYTGMATVALVQHVAGFLTRYERDPRLVFQLP
jgi:tetratricopeptide (TPR) repeat protein